MERNYTIAVIEDDLDIQQLLVSELEKQSYHVLAESDGEKAAEQLKQADDLDLIILDMMLPNKDGISILKEVRQESTVPVLILSAKDSEFDKIIGLEHGADDYLTKPFSVYELLARVRSILRRNSEYNLPVDNQPQQSSQTVFDFVLLPDEYAISKNDQHIQLTNKEYQLLKFFIDNPKKVFTKYQLYQEIWDDKFLNDDNVLNVTIHRLRKKIESDPSNPKYILTVWGIGYKLGESE